MYRLVCTFLAGTMIALSATAAPTNPDCQSSTSFEENLNELEGVSNQVEKCPKPTREQFLRVCLSVSDKETAKDETNFAYKYQEDLWNMSCAKAGKDTPEMAKQKIQIMWNAYRTEFSCPGTTSNTIQNGNITKFAVDDNFSTFLIYSIKKYELDMNFIDPKDGKTILDFIEGEIERFKKSNYTDKLPELQRIYDLLIKTGAKRAKELK